MTKKLLEITAEIVQTQVASNRMTSADIASSLRQVFQTLQEMQKAEGEGTVLTPLMIPEEAPKTLVPQASIQENKVTCLECGKDMRQLTSKHLVSHGMDQKEYRKKYGFTMRTPLAAKSLTKARSKSAKKRGLPENLTKYIEGPRKEKAESAAAGTVVETNTKPRKTGLRKKGAS